MSLLAFIALALALIVAVWAVMEREWRFLLLAAAVILLAFTDSFDLALTH